MTRSIAGRAIARHRTAVCARTRAVRSASSPNSDRSPKTSPGPRVRLPSGASTTALPSSSPNSPEPGSSRWMSARPAGAANSLVLAARRSSWSSSSPAKSSNARRRSRKLLTEAGKPEAAEGSACEPAQLRLLQAARGTDRLVHGGEHHVREQLGVVRIDRLRIDLDRFDLAGAVRGDGDHAAARAGLHRLVLELALRLLHLLLHLLGLLQELVHVHAHRQSSRSRASRVSLTSSRIFSSPAGPSSSSGCSARASPSANASPRWRPVTSYSASASSVAFFGSSASCRWNEALDRNSTVSVSPARSAGCASRSTDAAGIERSSTAGRIVRCHASCNCSSSSDGGSGEGRAGSSGRVLGTVPKTALSGTCARDSTCSSRYESDSRERSAPGRVTLTRASSRGRRGSPP